MRDNQINLNMGQILDHIKNIINFVSCDNDMICTWNTFFQLAMHNEVVSGEMSQCLEFA